MNSSNPASLAPSPTNSRTLFYPLKSLDTNCFTKVHLKTSNSEIFPSLNPLTGLYRYNQNLNHTSDARQGVSKRLRHIDGVNETIPKIRDCPPKKINIKQIKIEKLPSYNLEQPIFQIPPFEKINLSQKNEHFNLIEIHEQLRVPIEPLAVPDNVTYACKIQYSSQSSHSNNFTLNQIFMRDTEIKKSQTNRISDHFLDPQILYELYQNLKTEFHNLQERQCILEAQQVQYSRSDYVNQETDLAHKNKNIDKSEKLECFDTTSDDQQIKKEYVKKEIEY